MADEKMDTRKQIDHLNEALRLQHRSVLHYSLVAGSVIGLEYQAHAEKMREHSLSELEDATRLVEKITALGGDPTIEVAQVTWTPDPREALESLAEHEEQLLDALKAAITPSGQEARSEALEHLLEHIIMRKQEQVDALIRASGGPSRG